MKVYLHNKSILDIEVDVLVCSANVSLNMTGGVSADLVERYGLSMQDELHEQLENRTPRCAEPGEVFPLYSEGLPYTVVLHAVAVDPMYHSTEDVVAQTVRKALKMAAEHGAKSVALTALASGFGDLSLDEFAVGFRQVINDDFAPVESIHIAQVEDFRFDELCSALPEGLVCAD